MKPNINPEYIISLQGQHYCTYRGVLDCAHALGLEGIRTHLIQVPGPDNDFVAIVEAEVRMADGRVFTDVADASPKNVPSRLQPALIRMASTRAKGRALRDAVNIGEALAEELADVDTDNALPAAPAGRPASVLLRNPAPRAVAAAPAPAPVEEKVAEPEAPAMAFATPVPAPPAPQAPAPPVEIPKATPSPAETPAPAREAAPAEPRPEALVCSSAECGRSVTKGQYNYSLNTFGAALCPACQRKQQSKGRSA